MKIIIDLFVCGLFERLSTLSTHTKIHARISPKYFLTFSFDPFATVV